MQRWFISIGIALAVSLIFGCGASDEKPSKAEESGASDEKLSKAKESGASGEKHAYRAFEYPADERGRPGFFQREKDDIWKEYKNDREWATYTEQEQNKDHILLYSEANKVWIRLYADRAMWSTNRETWTLTGEGTTLVGGEGLLLTPDPAASHPLRSQFDQTPSAFNFIACFDTDVIQGQVNKPRFVGHAVARDGEDALLARRKEKLPPQVYTAFVSHPTMPSIQSMRVHARLPIPSMPEWEMAVLRRDRRSMSFDVRLKDYVEDAQLTAVSLGEALYTQAIHSEAKITRLENQKAGHSLLSPNWSDGPIFLMTKGGRDGLGFALSGRDSPWIPAARIAPQNLEFSRSEKQPQIHATWNTVSSSASDEGKIATGFFARHPSGSGQVAGLFLGPHWLLINLGTDELEVGSELKGGTGTIDKPGAKVTLKVEKNLYTKFFQATEVDRIGDTVSIEHIPAAPTDRIGYVYSVSPKGLHVTKANIFGNAGPVAAVDLRTRKAFKIFRTVATIPGEPVFVTGSEPGNLHALYGRTIAHTTRWGDRYAVLPSLDQIFLFQRERPGTPALVSKKPADATAPQVTKKPTRPTPLPASIKPASIKPAPVKPPFVAVAPKAPEPAPAPRIKPAKHPEDKGRVVFDKSIREGFDDTARAWGSRQVSLQSMMVGEAGLGRFVGTSMDAIFTVSPDHSDAQVDFAQDVGEDMKTAMNEAKRLARVRYPHWDRGEVIVSFADKYSDKDGGSAGTLFAMGLLGLLDGIEFDDHVAVTGDVTVDWKTRKVGGVAEKLRGARLNDVKLAIIPADNEDVMAELVLLHSPKILAELQIFACPTVIDAMEVARADRTPELQKAIDTFETKVAVAIRKKGGVALKDPAVFAANKEVVEAAPMHMSAKYLMLGARGKLPKKLNLNASLRQTIITAGPILAEDDPRRLLRQRLDLEDTLSRLQQLKKIQPLMHKDIAEVHLGVSRYVSAIYQVKRAAQNDRPVGLPQIKVLDQSMQALHQAFKNLDKQDVLEQLLNP